VSSRSTSYVYDELGRLKTAQTNDLTSANTWELKFSYDRYGNRLSQIPVAGKASMPMNGVLVDATTNHITSASYAYDAAGNMTSDGLYNYAYNAVGQMLSVTPVGSSTATASFSYDAAGLRVVKNSTVYVYSGRKVIAEYASGAAANSPTTEHIYRSELRLATITGGVTTYHYADHLSVRSDTDANGNVLRSYGSYPFGETWYETGTSDKWKFTSYEKDVESGLNYSSARFQSPRLGRFTSLDPVPGRRSNPQSLNRYAYANGDPINLIDPSGLEPECGEFTNCDGSYGQLLDDGPDCASTYAGCSNPADYGPPGIDFSNFAPCTGTCVFDGFNFNANPDAFASNANLGADLTFSGIPDDAGPTVQTDSMTGGAGGSDSFEEGSLAFAVFQGSRGTWANASGTINAVFYTELAAFGGALGAAYAPAAWAAGVNAYYAAGGYIGAYVLAGGGAVGAAGRFVFYSGPGQEAAARAWATENGAVGIWNTELEAYIAGGTMDAAEASELYAQGAYGEAHIFSTAPFTNFNNILYNNELPVLYRNLNVTRIVFHGWPPQ
jgi:RHS repeat-associated protein